jgi:hypothetical protein
VGKDYEVEPVSVSPGVFHPKISVLTGENEWHVLVGPSSAHVKTSQSPLRGKAMNLAVIFVEVVKFT